MRKQTKEKTTERKLVFVGFITSGDSTKYLFAPSKTEAEKENLDSYWVGHCPACCGHCREGEHICNLKT